MEFVEIIPIFLGIWKYGGLYPVFYFSGRNIKYCRSLWRKSGCWLLLSISTVVMTMIGWDRNNMDRLVVGSYEVVVVYNALLSATVCHQVAEKLQDLLNKSHAIFEELASLAHLNICIKGQYHLVIGFLIVQVVFFLFQIVTEVTLAVTHKVPFSWPDLVLEYLAICLDMQFQLFYIFIGSTVWKYYSNLNGFSSEFGHQYGWNRLKMNFADLNSVCHDLNSVLVLVIFCRFGVDFITILDDSFICTTSKYHANGVGILRIFNGIFNLVQKFLTVGSFIFVNAGVECQSKLAVENIHNIQTRIGRKNLPYKSMELYLLKSKLNECKFSVCGFFHLDWTLLYSMVAGITTYLVYLIQFREMEQSRSRVQ